MVIALMVLTISSLLIAAAFVAAQGDVKNTQHDLDGKRAYSAARAGLAAFLVQLNRNTELWESCPARGSTQVPGGPTNLRYSYTTVPANGASACSDRQPRGHADRLQHRLVPDEVHRHLRHAGGHPDDRRQLPPRLPARLPLVLGLRDARSEHLRRPGEQAGLRRVSAGRPAVGLRCDLVDHQRQAQRPDVHPGPVLDLRRADLRPAGWHGRRQHGRSGPADGPGPDHDLGLQQQRRPQRRPGRERALHHRAARQQQPARLRPAGRGRVRGHHRRRRSTAPR